MSTSIPLIGGIDIEGNVWTGGKPSLDWISSENSRPKSLFCYRKNDKNFRQYKERIDGLSLKFGASENESYNLHTFANNVSRHLEIHGMDSVFYVPDRGVMFNIMREYMLFTPEKIGTIIQDLIKNKYDDFDEDNCLDSREFLLNSLDSKFLLKISPYITSKTTGPEVWIRIVNQVQSSSVERLLKVSNDVRNMKLKNFKGENVSDYCSKMLTLCRDLDNGQRLPKEISLTILDQLCECSVAPFKHQFFAYRNKILEELRESHGLSDIIWKETQIAKDWMTYEILLQKADAAYKTLRDLDKWGPSVTNKDRMVTPDTYITQAEANVLVEKAVEKYKKSFQTNRNNNNRSANNNSGSGSGTSNNQSKKNDGSSNTNGKKCLRCNSPDHLIANCPQRTNWKNKAPRSGTPQTKSVDGKEYHWCAKCNGGKGRWSPTHGTSEHKAGQNIQQSNPSTNEGNVHEGLYCQWTDNWLPEANVCCFDNYNSSDVNFLSWFYDIIFFITVGLDTYFNIFLQHVEFYVDVFLHRLY